MTSTYLTSTSVAATSMPLALPSLSKSFVQNLVHDMDTKGFACIPNYVSNEDLKRMQDFVDDQMRKSNYEYRHFNGAKAVAGSGLDDFGKSPEFQQLIYSVYELGTGKKAVPEEFYQVLRCLAGQTGKKNSLIFHYDSYVVTALVPIRIPTTGMTGDLLMYPNTRRIRPFYLFNALDKVLLDNKFTQKILGRIATKGGRFSPKRVKMTPGNLYLFWGYRSVHTNEPCDPDQVRSTAIFHYHNPHRKPAA